MMTFIVEPPKLAEPEKDSAALKLSAAMNAKLEEAQNHILNELDELIAQIDKIKSEIRQSTNILQGEVLRHFTLAAEARAFTNKVEKRLNEVQNGTPPGVQQTPPAEPA